MTVKFVLLVNKQGQTRLAKYTDQSLSVEERRALEGEIVRKCLARSEKQVCKQGCAVVVVLARATPMFATQSLTWVGLAVLQCSFTELRNMKVVYRRYASLFFLVGIDEEEVRPHSPLLVVTASFSAPPAQAVQSPLHPQPGCMHTIKQLGSAVPLHAPVACGLTEVACEQNELAILEFIHCLVETLDRYFSNVCELDLMFNLEMVRACQWRSYTSLMLL